MFKGKFGSVFKKCFLIFACISFFWATGSRVFNMMTNPQTDVASQTETESKSPEESLKEAEKGYQTVLEKEPNNRFALEKLMEIDLQLQDLQGALESLEKLVELYPENQQYRQTLEYIKENLAQASRADGNPSLPAKEETQMP